MIGKLVDTARRSRANTDAKHTYLLEDIPRDVYEAVMVKARAEDPPTNFKQLVFRWMRKYARKPLRKPQKGRNPLRMF